jgi:aminodeoxyfutalosine deaminase
MTDRLAGPPGEADLAAWLRDLPKVELHVHLEGSLTPAVVARLAERHGADPSAIWPEGIPEAFSFVDFPDFGRQFLFGLTLIRDGEDLADVAEALGRDLAAQSVRYAEVTSTAFSHLRRGMAEAEYGAALDEGRRRAAAIGVELAWVIDIPRDLERPESTGTVDHLSGPHAPGGVVALGLGGYEVGHPAGPYREQFERARALGLGSVPHAGETDGPASVREALEELGADRIGHGVRSVEDEELVAELAERGTCLEVCLTSNRLLGVVDDLARHPLPDLLAAGVTVSLNTDDPGYFATDLTTELVAASEHFGLTADDHVVLQRTAVAASFLPAARQAALVAELDAYPLTGAAGTAASRGSQR